VNVVAYLRVSTDRQAEQGTGLDVQADAIERWAKVGGHEVVEWYRDEAVSGTMAFEERVALGAALEALKAGTAGGLVVYRLDRLARDLVIQEQLLAELRRLGATLFSTSAAENELLVDDPDDPTRKLVRQVLGAVSEFERSMITLRMRTGRQRKAEQGGYAYGAPPFGQAAASRSLRVDDAEQEVVELIGRLREEGQSLRAIARTLDETGVPSKRGAARWHAKVVADILRRSDASETPPGDNSRVARAR
jgi:DNA invertase Pin-like site-specific DNA recombinase